MKNLVFLCAIFFSVNLNLKAGITDTIPNGGFERWFIFTWFTNPADWQTNNTSILAATIELDADAYSGDYAMRMVNSGALIPECWTGFNINSHPLSLNGYVKDLIQISDSAILTVKLYYNSQVIDSGMMLFMGGFNPNYHSFTIPISQNNSLADSCEIRIIGGFQNGSSITFDELSFGTSSSIQNIDESKDLLIYPNPAANTLSVRLPLSHDDQYKIIIYNAAGSIQKEIRKASHSGIRDIQKRESVIPIDVNDLDPGIYLIRLEQSSKELTGTFIKK